MFKNLRKTDEVLSPAEIAKKTVLDELDVVVTNAEYEKAKTLADVYKTLAEADKHVVKQPSDQVVVACISAAASLLGIFAVIRHEEMNVIASKALGFVVKTKL